MGSRIIDSTKRIILTMLFKVESVNDDVIFTIIYKTNETAPPIAVPAIMPLGIQFL